MSDTPEKTYDELYAEEMARLEAADAEKATTTETKEPIKTAEDVVQQTQEEQKPDPNAEWQRKLDELNAQLQAKDKALRDTQAWGHENARRAKELERSQVKKPQLLEEMPELADVVRHVNQENAENAQASYQQRNEQAIALVSKSMPDLHQLLSDPDFYKAMENRRNAVGAMEFDLDPAVMIRELTAEKEARNAAKFESQKQAALEAARKDYEKQSRSKSSMTMPGAASGAGRTAKDLSYDDVMNMSDADFKRMQSKALGY